MEVKRLEWLNICYKSTDLTVIWLLYTPSIDAVIDRFATIAGRMLNFLIWTYTCTSVHCTVQQTFLNIDILNT